MLSHHTDIPAQIQELITELAMVNGPETSEKAVLALLEQQGMALPESVECFDDAIQYAMDRGLSADQLAVAIWGEGQTWDSVSTSYTRGEDAFIAVWCDAGYKFQQIGGGCTGISTIVEGVEFLITTIDGSTVPNPDFACIVGAYDPVSMEYLNVMAVASSKVAVEGAMPGLIVQVRALLQD